MSGSARDLDQRRELIVAVPGLDATTHQIMRQSRKLGTRAEVVEGPQRIVERRGIGRHGGGRIMSVLRPTADLGARSSVQPLMTPSGLVQCFGLPLCKSIIGPSVVAAALTR